MSNELSIDSIALYQAGSFIVENRV